MHITKGIEREGCKITMDPFQRHSLTWTFAPKDQMWTTNYKITQTQQYGQGNSVVKMTAARTDPKMQGSQSTE